MAAPTSALLTKYIAQYRALGLRCLLTFAGLALAALLILGPSDGRPPRDEKAVAAQPSPTRSPRPTTTRSPAATPTRAPRTPGSTNAPEAAPDPGPGPADAGGDQPSAPLPPVYGGIPENVNASPEFLGLKDQLAAEIAAYDAADHIDVSVAVTDLQTGETISVNGNDAHRTGCTIMMFALLAAVNEFQAGHGDPAARR